MNEQEYEKSIARPTLVPERCPQTLTDREIKEEREFSRGVWEAYKALDCAFESLHVSEPGSAAGVVYRAIKMGQIKPIPDAPPKPEPIHPAAQRVVNAIANAIMEGGRPLDRGLAEQIVATIRSWTVK